MSPLSVFMICLEERWRMRQRTFPQAAHTEEMCCSHTQPAGDNDVSKVVGWNYGTGRQARQPFTKAAAKAQGLWNLHNRSLWWPTRSGCGGQKAEYTLPNYVEHNLILWNTLYDATECLLKTALKDPETIEAINEVMKSEAAGKRAAAPVFTEEEQGDSAGVLQGDEACRHLPGQAAG
ncbi:hypothetical protein GWK47_027147 [Chionoecetes opilio]|uniref:Uncharacterized protein n=1 Tax=Chionoecetes opilio TaxID=41210 RepID=A0A8J8W9Q8_CHIOP|nr:hypothetical protein GWK47_027147 [Chionoecetes opilio]